MNKIGIIGCGVIGGVMKKWLEINNKNVQIKISDPPQNYNDDLSDVEVAFISIHIPTEKDGTQDLSLLKNIITSLPDIPIYIRTTLLPGTCDKLSKELNKQIYFMPEFLTERTAYSDFCSQPMIFTGNTELLKAIFTGKQYIEMSNIEAEITKYAHNVFGAVKVTYCNCIYDICQKIHCDYSKVQAGILQSGYINEPHTNVPGPDGKLGYGGKCFPKDVKAFMEYAKNYNLYKLLKITNDINTEFRND